MKVISATTHGILDYLMVAIFLLAPSLLGLGGVASRLSYGLAVIHLIMTLLTDMPLGLVKLIPMTLHAFAEMLVGPALVASALLLPSFFGGGREFFLVMGFVIFAVWLLSDYGKLTTAH